VTARKGWSTGGKVAAWLLGGAAVLYGAHRVFNMPAVQEREVFLAVRLIGIHVQRPKEAAPEDPPNMTPEAGRQAMVALFPADIVDRWIRSGFTFWAPPKIAADVEKAAKSPEVARLGPDALARIRAAQAKLGET
jgi:hypothetical protein